MSKFRLSITLGLALVVLAACGRGDPTLLNLRQDGDGPDEFSVLPSRPLEMPQDLAALPTPTLGGGNLADPDPEADIAAALGGNVNRASAGSQALVGHATRFGVSAGIRETLAAEDLEFRRRNDGRLLERIFAVNVYFRAYREQSLDQYLELERMRAAGIRTPAAPPEEIGNLN